MTHVLKIIEESNYYAFGLKHGSYNSDRNQYKHGTTGAELEACASCPNNGKYKYNGQEFQDELGLNMTAMDFRQYDNAIGRFVGMDALSEMGFSVTPYHFANNNPVYFNDPTGLTPGRATNQWLRDFNGEWHHVDASAFVRVWDSDDSESIGDDAIEVFSDLGLSIDGSGGGGPGPTFQQRLTAFMNALGISTSTKELVLSLADKALIPDVLKGTLKILGRVAGAYSVYEAIDAYMDNPTTANLVRLTVNAGMFVGSFISSGGTLSSSIGFGMALFDATVGSNAYGLLGGQIDSMVGYSVGQSVYNSVSGILNNFRN